VIDTVPQGHGADLVSVIMIFLDAEAFIEEAVESVRQQTVKNWELVLVDDGSTDGSTALARVYAADDPARIHYIEHPRHQNRGMSASRNLGIAHAAGNFIAFLDADDVWLPERLERHLGVLQAHDEVGMVYGPTLYWHSWSAEQGLRPRTDRPGKLNLEAGRPIAPPAALLEFLKSGGASLPGIGSLLARRDAVEKVGGFEESFRGLYEDQVFLTKMCLVTPVMVIDEVLDKYRQHAGSYCYQAVARKEYDPIRPHPARERYLRWLDGYLRVHQPRDLLLSTALRKQRWPYQHPQLYALQQVFRAVRKSTCRFLGRARGWLWRCCDQFTAARE
jgi:glycosyltransferase involved in cell wall biosynthesis